MFYSKILGLVATLRYIPHTELIGMCENLVKIVCKCSLLKWDDARSKKPTTDGANYAILDETRTRTSIIVLCSALSLMTPGVT